MRILIIVFAFMTAACGQVYRIGGGLVSDCDRTCLISLTNAYLTALAAHDFSRVQWMGDARFVENAQRLPVGEGLWKTASAPPNTFMLVVPDPVSGQVGLLAVMEEEGKPILLGLRLRFASGRIIEAEHLVARNLREEGLRNLQSPRPGLLARPFTELRDSRDALLRTAAPYYDALIRGDGQLAPFAEDCVRHENGIQVTGRPAEGATGTAILNTLGCAAQLDTKTMAYITRIDNRRVTIADPETGLVFGLSHFRHPMTQKEYPIVGVPGVTSRTVEFDPFDLPAAHIFKVQGGRIHEIEAMGFRLPYNSATGWE